jgi:transcriptional regulator with XRE-family HTH domain
LTQQLDSATLAAELRREIAAALASAGLSQRDLSESTGIAQSGISRALTGTADPQLSTLVRLLAAVGCRLRVELVDTPNDVEIATGTNYRTRFSDKREQMPTTKFNVSRNEVCVLHSSDWAGDVEIVWSDSGTERRVKMPGNMLLSISSAIFQAKLAQRAKAFVDRLTFRRS